MRDIMVKKNLPDRIMLNNMVFHGHVGVLPAEKAKGQPFEIDMVIYCRHIPACESDLLSQTVDYGEVYSQVEKIMQEAKYDLIEKLAGTIAEQILRTFRLADAIEIRIRKPQAPIEGQFASMGVSIYRERK